MTITAFGDDPVLSGGRLEVPIRIVDDGPHGIGLVQVFDTRGARVSGGFTDFSADDLAERCPSYAELTVVVTPSQFPLVVEAEDCNEDDPEVYSTPLRSAIPSETMEDIEDGIRLPCPDTRVNLICREDPECEQAQLEVSTTRLEITGECREVARLERERDEWAVAAKTTLDHAIGFASSAASLTGVPLIGNALSVIAAIIAAVLFVLAAVFSVLTAVAQGHLDSAEARLVDARSRFTDAARAVLESCCPGCVYVDTEHPEC